MDTKRLKILLSVLVFFSLILILFRVGSLGRDIAEQREVIEKMGTNLSKKVDGLSNSQVSKKDDKDYLTEKTIIKYNKFSKKNESVTVSFSVLPKELSDTMEVTASNDDYSFKLKRNTYSFVGKKSLKLEDKLPDIITYHNNGKILNESISGVEANAKLGDLVLPKFTIEKKSLDTSLTAGSYNVEAAIKIKTIDGLNDLVSNDMEEKSIFESLELDILVNGEVKEKKEFDITNPNFSEEYNEIKHKIQAEDMDKIELLLVARDDNGLDHIAVLDLQNEEDMQALEPQVRVYGKDKKKEIFKYKY